MWSGLNICSLDKIRYQHIRYHIYFLELSELLVIVTRQCCTIKLHPSSGTDPEYTYELVSSITAS